MGRRHQRNRIIDDHRVALAHIVGMARRGDIDVVIGGDAAVDGIRKSRQGC